MKYFIPILFVNGGLSLITLGVLFIKKDITPSLFAENKKDKIKTRLIGTIFFLPSLLIANLAFFELSNKTTWKVLCVILTISVIASCYLDFRNWQELKKSNSDVFNS